MKEPSVRVGGKSGAVEEKNFTLLGGKKKTNAIPPTIRKGGPGSVGWKM